MNNNFSAERNSSYKRSDSETDDTRPLPYDNPIVVDYTSLARERQNINGLITVLEESSSRISTTSTSTSQGNIATAINDLAEKVNSLTGTLKELLNAGHNLLQQAEDKFKEADQQAANSQLASQ